MKPKKISHTALALQCSSGRQRWERFRRLGIRSVYVRASDACTTHSSTLNRANESHSESDDAGKQRFELRRAKSGSVRGGPRQVVRAGNPDRVLNFPFCCHIFEPHATNGGFTLVCDPTALEFEIETNSTTKNGQSIRLKNGYLLSGSAM